MFYWAFGSLNCHPQLVGSESALITGTVTAPVIEYTPEWIEIEKTQDVLWDADNERYLRYSDHG